MSLESSIAANGFSSGSSKLPPSSTEKTTKTNTNSPMAGSPTNIGDAPILITRDMIGSSNSITSYGHRWSITLKKWGKYSVDNPFSQSSGSDYSEKVNLPYNMIPALSFRYDTYKSNTESIQLLSDFGINIPYGFSYNKSISITLFNDKLDTVRNYLRYYKNLVNPSYKSTRPYKDCCSILGINIYNLQLELLHTYELYVIPDLSDEAVSDQANKSFDLGFNIFGESDKNEGK